MPEERERLSFCAGESASLAIISKRGLIFRARQCWPTQFSCTRNYALFENMLFYSMSMHVWGHWGSIGLPRHVGCVCAVLSRLKVWANFSAVQMASMSYPSPTPSVRSRRRAAREKSTERAGPLGRDSQRDSRARPAEMNTARGRWEAALGTAEACAHTHPSSRDLCCCV